MPPKATAAAVIAVAVGLPSVAFAFTLPDGALRPAPGVVLAQAKTGEAGKRVEALREELKKAREALQEAKKSGGDIEAAQKRVAAAEEAIKAARKSEKDAVKKAGDEKPDRKQRKAEDKAEDTKKAQEPSARKEQAEDKPAEEKRAEEKPARQPRKAKETAAEPPQQAEKEAQPKAEKKAGEQPQATKEGKREKPADQPKATKEQKQEKSAEQPREAKEQKQPETETKDTPRKAEQEAEPEEKSDDDATRKRAAEQPQPDSRRSGPRDDRGDRKRVVIREGQKTPAKELATKRIEEGKEAVIDGGERVLRREGGRIVVRSDDRDRFDRGERRDERLDDGRIRIVINRPDGTQVITVRDRDGNIVRRARRMRDGREIVIIDEDEWRRDGRDRDRHADRDRDRDWDRYRGRDRHRDFRVELGPLRITIPRERYIVESRGASRRQLEEALIAPPVEPVEQYYSLEDVRSSDRLRDKMRRIDVTAITFETDSAAISESEIGALEELGYVLQSIIERHPEELFLIEGHTDAVGSDIYNLALSDRRAESVAIALSDYFNVPPENLVTQGYGESYLKIPTPGAERENRRVTVRRITPLIRSAEH